MTKLADYQNGFANARLSRSKSGVLEVVLHTNGDNYCSMVTRMSSLWIFFMR